MSAKRLPPFSLRLSAEERARLDSMANGEPLGAFIKTRLLESPPQRGTPFALAQLLGLMGRSDIAASMRALAQAAERDLLDFDPEARTTIHDACANIALIKSMLMRALHVKED